MKRFLLVLVLVVQSSTAFASESKPISSKIDAVTVYQDRALVSRIGRITLPVGVHTVALEGLPIGLEDNSVRVSGEAAGAAILDILVKTTTSVPPPSDSVQEARRKKIYDKIRELEVLQVDNNDRISVLSTQKNFLDQIRVQTGGSINEQLKLTRPTSEDWQKFVDFMGNNSSKLVVEQRKLERANNDLRVKIDSMRQSEKFTPLASSKSVKTILVEIDVTRAGEVELSASYVVPGARWYPTYDLRVLKASKEVQLDYRAAVRQNTGEDWNNVNITLSTARPDVGGNQPELSAWYISGSEPVKPQVQKTRADDGAVALSPGTRSSRNQSVLISSSSVQYNSMDMRELIAQPFARVESDYYSTMFDIVAKSTIPTDDIPHKVLVSKLKLAAEFGYSATPKLSNNVYLKAKIKNSSEIPILPGVMNIFSDRDYISQSSLPLISPSEIFTASIGIDPSITIHRNRVNRITENSGVFTKSRVIQYDYEFILQNNRKKDTVTVEVLDQIPLAQNEKILIEQIEPTAKELQKSTYGVITWKHELKPNEKKTWRLKFSVEYPVDYIMQGIE